MDTTKHSDAGHPGPSTDPSPGVIELDDLALEEFPSASLHRHSHSHEIDREEVFPRDEPEDESDDSGGEDEGERALLGPRARPRGRERSVSPIPRDGVWVQVRGIVIEVFLPLGVLPCKSTI